MKKSKKAIVIGAGFSGLAAASVLAKAGWEVEVLEKNSTVGGRARVLKKDGFVFDMGPSWYWMPDVMEEFLSEVSIHNFRSF
jgi:phytoene desaturase